MTELGDPLSFSVQIQISSDLSKWYRKESRDILTDRRDGMFLQIDRSCSKGSGLQSSITACSLNNLLFSAKFRAIGSFTISWLERARSTEGSAYEFIPYLYVVSPLKGHFKM